MFTDRRFDVILSQYMDTFKKLIIKAFISQGEQQKFMPVQCGVRGQWTTRNIGRARTQETMAARDLTRLYK